jgi:hypothetical protein
LFVKNKMNATVITKSANSLNVELSWEGLE